VPPVEWCSLDANGSNNTGGRVRTGADGFFVRGYSSLSYDDPASIAYENQLVGWLTTRGLSFTVPLPIRTRDDALVALHGLMNASSSGLVCRRLTVVSPQR
jgi:hypothetical protein